MCSMPRLHDISLPQCLSLQVVTEAETACQKWGGSVFIEFTIYIHSEYIWHNKKYFTFFI